MAVDRMTPLDELVAGMTPTNRGAEVDIGPEVGREVPGGGKAVAEVLPPCTKEDEGQS